MTRGVSVAVARGPPTDGGAAAGAPRRRGVQLTQFMPGAGRGRPHAEQQLAVPSSDRPVGHSGVVVRIVRVHVSSFVAQVCTDDEAADGATHLHGERVFGFRERISGHAQLNKDDLLRVRIVPSKQHASDRGSAPWFVEYGEIVRCEAMDVDEYLSAIEDKLGLSALEPGVHCSELARVLVESPAQLEHLIVMLPGLREHTQDDVIIMLGRLTWDCTTVGLAALVGVLQVLERSQFWDFLLDDNRWIDLHRCHESLLELIQTALSYQGCANALRLAAQIWRQDPELIADRIAALFEAAADFKQQSTHNMDLQNSQFIEAVTAPRREKRMLPLPVEQRLTTQAWVEAIEPHVCMHGPYPSPDRYFDVQHHLMRAEMFADLCGTLQAMQQHGNIPRGVFVYDSVTITHAGFEWLQGHLLLSFAMSERLQSYDWSTSKRLMTDNLVALVVLTPDSKMQVFWAIISFRHTSLLKKGVVGITFYQHEQPLSDQQMAAMLMNPNNRTRMVETPVYFHSTAPVVSVLRERSERNFPFVAQMIDLEPDLQPLRPQTTVMSMASLLPSDATGSSQPATLRQVLDLLHTPQRTICEASQAAAIRATLNSRFSLIQGPPGTGKTFVAKRIIELLMSVDEEELGGPILVLSYKNHAIDQFCHGLHSKFKQHMVRVGGPFDATSPIADVHYREVSSRFRLPRSSVCAARDDAARAFDVLKQLSERLATCGLSLQVFMQHATEQQLAGLLHFDERLLTDEEGFSAVRTGGRPREAMNTTWGRLDQALRQLLQVPAAQRYEHLSEWPDLFEAFRRQFDTWKPSPQAMEAVSIAADASPDELHEVVLLTDQDSVDEDENEDEKERQDDDADDNLVPAAAAAAATTTAGVATAAGDMHTSSSRVHRRALKQRKLEHILDIAPQDPAALPRRRLTVEVNNLSVTPWRDLSKEQHAATGLSLLQAHFQHLQQLFFDSWQKHRAAVSNHDLLMRQRMECVLQSHRLIFMTVSGAILHRDALAKAKPAVVLVEEAAEIMEAQLVAAIPTSTQQLIMIGDHKQLRPNLNCFELRKVCHSDVSAFERLWGTPGAVCCTLQLQARMPDELAQFGRIPGLYDRYETWHTRVANAPRIPWLDKRLYFVDTGCKEIPSQGTSHINPGEAEYMARVLKRLIELDTPHASITLLAAYAGQVSLLRRLIHTKDSPVQRLLTTRGFDKSSALDIRICTIDQFQGDENDVILVSLVRSDKIGYVAAPNRMCVALTRSRGTTIVFGNRELCESDGGDHWRHALAVFQRARAIVRELPFTCKRHPLHSTVLPLHNPGDVEPPICGGVCGDRMVCGHDCEGRCHGGPHAMCRELCAATMPCGHVCIARCHGVKPSDAVHDCNTKCNEELPCGHLCDSKCHFGHPHPACEQPCRRKAHCPHAHDCELKCGQPCPNERGCPPCAILADEVRVVELSRKQAAILAQREQLTRDLRELAARRASRGLDALSSSSQAYKSALDIVDVFCRSRPNVVPWFPHVTDVFGIRCSELERDAVLARKALVDPTLPPMQMIHATEWKEAEQIAKDGFSREDSAGPFGPGYYLRLNTRPVGESKSPCDTLIVCDVYCGTSYRATTPDRRLSGQRQRRYDSVVWPHDFSEDAAYDVVVFDKRLIVPRFLVKVARIDELYRRMMLNHKPIRSSWDYLHLLPPSAADAGTDEAMLFNIAHAQFAALIGAPRPSVISITVIRNVNLANRYQDMKEWMMVNSIQPNEHWVFHGTRDTNFKLIAETGLQLGGRQGVAVSNGTAYGPGIYTATKPDTAMGYARGANKILMCKILLGRSSQVPLASIDALRSTAAQSYSPVSQPTFRIAFNPEQVLPAFIVEYTSL